MKGWHYLSYMLILNGSIYEVAKPSIQKLQKQEDSSFMRVTHAFVFNFFTGKEGALLPLIGNSDTLIR
jgi:hypothetical protein